MKANCILLLLSLILYISGSAQAVIQVSGSSFDFTVFSSTSITCLGSGHSYIRPAEITTTDGSSFSVLEANSATICSQRTSTCSTQSICFQCSGNPRVFVVRNHNWVQSARMRISCGNPVSSIYADAGSRVSVPEKANSLFSFSFTYNVCSVMSSAAVVSIHNNDTSRIVDWKNLPCQRSLHSTDDWTLVGSNYYDANARKNFHPHAHIRICSTSNCLSNVVVSKAFPIFTNQLYLDKTSYHLNSVAFLDWRLSITPSFYLVLLPSSGELIATKLSGSANPLSIYISSTISSSSNSGTGYILHCSGTITCRNGLSSTHCDGNIQMTSSSNRQVECPDSNGGIRSDTFSYSEAPVTCWGQTGRAGCSGNGNCISLNRCSCDVNYSGERCETHNAPPTCWGQTGSSACSGRGDCVSNDRCTCNEGWAGERCEQRAANSLTIELTPRFPSDHYAVQWNTYIGTVLRLYIASNQTMYYRYLGLTNTARLSGRIPSPLLTGNYTFMHCDESPAIQGGLVICPDPNGGTVSSSFVIQGVNPEHEGNERGVSGTNSYASGSIFISMMMVFMFTTITLFMHV